MNITLRHLLVLAASVALPVFADGPRIESYRVQLRAVRPPELARETVRLILAAHADPADAVTAAITLNIPSAPLVVGSVAKAAPQSAATAAAAGIASQPKQAGFIAKAAVSAAPSEIAAIVTASCQARPSSFYIIGIGAAEAAPKSIDKIVPAIIAAIPALKPVIDRARNDFKAANRAASLAMLLKHAENILAALSQDQNVSAETLLAKETDSTLAVKLATKAMGPPPVLGPPFVPGGTPSEIPASSTEMAPPCRCYEAP